MTSDLTLLQIEVFATTEKNEKEFFDESQRRISFNTSELQFAIKELPDDRMTSKTICNTAIAVVFADESSSCSAARLLLVFLPLLLSTTISNSLIITSTSDSTCSPLHSVSVFPIIYQTQSQFISLLCCCCCC